MKQITDIHELRQLQMGILDHVHAFCEANGLTYFLSSGMLIGAVRHGGYIPWDDDIDIYMPRCDYERFLQIYSDPSGVYRAIDPQRDPKYYYTFAKVIDQRTLMLEKEVKGYEIGVYIDIFPLDFSCNIQEWRRSLMEKQTGSLDLLGIRVYKSGKGTCLQEEETVVQDSPMQDIGRESFAFPSCLSLL